MQMIPGPGYLRSENGVVLSDYGISWYIYIWFVLKSKFGFLYNWMCEGKSFADDE